MHYFITDETNNAYVADKFFIYGGLVMTDEQMIELHKAIEGIRTQFGFQPGDSLKFHTRSRPEHVTIENAKAAKEAVIAALERLGIRMIVYLIHHDIASAQNDEVRTNWALNTVTWAYRRLLVREGARGIMHMDRADEQHVHLARMFGSGLLMQDGRSVHVDDRIVLFGMTSDGASHVASAVDIALGGFRYCVNAAGGDGRDVVAADIFPPLARIIWGIEVGGVKYIRNYGYHPMPKGEIRSTRFKAKYDELSEKLNEYAGNSENEVEDPEPGADA